MLCTNGLCSDEAQRLDGQVDERHCVQMRAEAESISLLEVDLEVFGLLVSSASKPRWGAGSTESASEHV